MLSCQESTSPTVYQVEPGCYPSKKAPPRQYTRWNLNVILPRKHLPDGIPGGTWMLSFQESTSPTVYQVEPGCYPAKKAPPRQYTRWNLDVILPRKHLPDSIPGGTWMLSCQESTSPTVYQVEPGCYPAKKAPPRQYTRGNMDVILPRKHLPDSIPGRTWMLSCQESTSPTVYQVEPGCYPAKKAPPRQYTRWNLDVILPRKHLPGSIPGGTWMLSCQESTSPAVYQGEHGCYPAKKAPPRQYTRGNMDLINAQAANNGPIQIVQDLRSRGFPMTM